MKIRLLLSFIILFFISCSSDDTTTYNDAVEKHLKEISKVIDGQQIELNKFENNRLTERYLYNNNQLYFENYYTYNEEGYLTERYSENFNTQETSNQILEYDDLGKLILIETQYTSDGVPSYSSEQNFDYNTLNKIIETETSSVQPQAPKTYVYDIINNNLVYKVTHDGDNPTIFEGQYQGGNLVTQLYTNYINGSYVTQTTNFTYTTINVIEDNTNQNNYFEINSALLNRGISNPKVYYILSAQNDNGNTTFEYELDEDGYPTKIESFNNGELSIQYYYSYE
ncbi:hypothetical protein [Flavobacterium litorale]|uniref:YD repeat-containing protein n=1 Tax=Flavobacterium litorale TaxID=2856519 RepID=A0ABX8V3M5_9FLAO|nr:hypothetical protein [Flavobacterium litorale]QYJ67444.1 hypothetical protein K1I41_07705 [Flavobacterium litorale]